MEIKVRSVSTRKGILPKFLFLPNYVYISNLLEMLIGF